MSVRQEVAAILMDHAESIPDATYRDILEALGRIPEERDPTSNQDLRHELESLQQRHEGLEYQLEDYQEMIFEMTRKKERLARDLREEQLQQQRVARILYCSRRQFSEEMKEMLHYQRHLLWKLRQAGVEPPPYRGGREEVEEDLDEYLDGVSILMESEQETEPTESKEVYVTWRPSEVEFVDDTVRDDDSLSDAGPYDLPHLMPEVTQYLLSERLQRRRAMWTTTSLGAIRTRSS